MRGLLVAAVVLLSLRAAVAAPWVQIGVPASWRPQSNLVANDLATVRANAGGSEVDAMAYRSADGVVATIFNVKTRAEGRGDKPAIEAMERELARGASRRATESISSSWEWDGGQLVVAVVDGMGAAEVRHFRRYAVDSHGMVHLSAITCAGLPAQLAECQQIGTAMRIVIADQVEPADGPSVLLWVLPWLAALALLTWLVWVRRWQIANPWPPWLLGLAAVFVSAGLSGLALGLVADVGEDAGYELGKLTAPIHFGIGVVAFFIQRARVRSETVQLPIAIAHVAAASPAPATRSPSSTIPPFPEELRGKVSYAVVSGEVTAAGIDARRENGTAVLVLWADVVGVVARRMPDDYQGLAFVDLVSTEGATLRLLRSSRLSGLPPTADDERFTRALLELVIRSCPDAKLDRMTREFHEWRGGLPQLPDAETLAAHDARFA